MVTRESRLSRQWVAAILIGLAAVAFASRVLPALSIVFPESDEVRLLGNDAYYHFRHARFAADHFPEFQRRDLGTHYPSGQGHSAAGLFDLTIAAIAFAISGGTPDELAVFRASAWLPPFFLALTIPALYWYARFWLPRSWALVACGTFLLVPAESLVRTMLGFGDHHVAEILFSLLSAGGLAHCLTSTRNRPPISRWLQALGCALPMMLFIYMWSGAPLFLLVIGFVMALVCLLEIARGGQSRSIGQACFRYGVALLGWLWFTWWLWPELVLVPDVFPSVLLTCGALALGPWTLTRAAGYAIDRRLSPVGVAWAAAGLLVIAIAAAITLHPSGHRLTSIAFGVKTDFINEHRAVTAQHFWKSFGPVGILALLGVLLGVRASLRERDARSLIPILFSVAVVALWWRTHDYGYLAPAFIAVPAAWTGISLQRWICAVRRPVVTGLVLASILFIPIVPYGGIYRAFFVPSEVRNVRTMHDGWFQAARWLRDNTPPPTLAADANVSPSRRGRFTHPEGSYGVFVGWSFGSFVAAVSRRPVVWSRGTHGDPTGSWLVGTGERESLEALCPRCRGSEEVRYILVDARSVADSFSSMIRRAGLEIGHYREVVGEFDTEDGVLPRFRMNDQYDRSMVARLYLQDGIGFGHYQMVYESPHQSWVVSLSRPEEGDEGFVRRSFPIDNAADQTLFPEPETPGAPVKTAWGYAYDSVAVASVKIFERVEGARLTGSVPGAAEVEARLALHAVPSNRDFEYVRRTRVEADGRFELVVPYATQGRETASAIITLGAYSLESLGRSGTALGSVDVTTDQIRSGAQIAVGALAEGKSTAPLSRNP